MIGEGAQRTQATLTYAITRSELTELQIRIPARQKIAGVFDANVRRWDVEIQENTQVIKVELFEPATATQNISLELERFDLEVGMQNEAVEVTSVSWTFMTHLAPLKMEVVRAICQSETDSNLFQT